MKYALIDSPLGALLTVRDEVGLTMLYLPTGKNAKAPDPTWNHDEGAFADVGDQLEEYFAGRRQHFELALHPSGTEFQQRVWKQLRSIPYGETASYGQTAAAIGHPNGSRAVGLANGRNPISIIVPCHRVIGANGSMTGYGGGIEAKQWLLAHERRVAGSTLL